MSLKAIHSAHCATHRYGGGPCDCGVVIPESKPVAADLAATCDSIRTLIATWKDDMILSPEHEVFLELQQVEQLLEAADRCNAIERLFKGMADPQKEITALKDRLAVANEMVELWKSWAKQAMIRHPDLRNDVAQVAP